MATGPPPERKYETWYEPGATPSFWKQYSERMWEHPIIPFGLATTVVILAGGLRSFIKGASGETQNKWMRARVIAQGFTIVAIGYYSMRPNEEKQKLEEGKKERVKALNQPEKPKDVVTIN